MSDDEIIAVVRAHKEGKKIQFRPSGATTEWVTADERGPNWNFEFMDYRVAPLPRKPREWRVCLLSDGSIMPVKPQDPHHCIIVREVIE